MKGNCAIETRKRGELVGGSASGFKLKGANLKLRDAPIGYYFEVITHGFGAMPDYAAQILPRDRWCIVAYIRALQLSQNATAADIAGQQIPSAAPAFEEPGSGATLPVPLPSETGSSSGEEQK